MAPTIAYVSMEIALESDLPTYAGGLGVLAGDTLRAAADLSLPVVGVTLVHREGYFRQRVEAGEQREEPDLWSPADRLSPAAVSVQVPIGDRFVAVRAWRYDVRGIGGEVPVYLLDTDLPENEAEDRRITGGLYRGDARDRLRQEIVLGLGGVAVLEALGMQIETWHMNEGHSAFLVLPVAEREAGGDDPDAGLAAARGRCVFTTHTPVAAGHDRFQRELLVETLGEARTGLLEGWVGFQEGRLNMTRLALAASRWTNGVSARHAAVSAGMFPGHEIRAVTNGVHAAFWTSPAMADLFDRRFPEWRRHNAVLRQAALLPLEEIRAARAVARTALSDEVRRRTGTPLDPGALTLGFARRATAYKRADLLFSAPERLRRIARDQGPLQVVYAGKAHPRDLDGKAMIRRVHEGAEALEGDVRVIWLEDYDMDLARTVCAGVDVWLNTPQRPLEASGTSGMKAALNGVPSLSVPDGWWVEGLVEGVTGWSIGGEWDADPDPEAEAESLYRKMEEVLLPLFHERPDDWARVARSAIALNGSHFTTQRMVEEYDRRAYRPA